MEGCVVVPIVLDVLGVPVNQSTGPVNGSLAVGGETCGPEGKLHTGRCLRKIPLIRGRVPSVRTLLRAANLSIYQPSNCIWSPIDLVGVVVVECVRKGDVELVVVYLKLVQISNLEIV